MRCEVELNDIDLGLEQEQCEFSAGSVTVTMTTCRTAYQIVYFLRKKKFKAKIDKIEELIIDLNCFFVIDHVSQR